MIVYKVVHKYKLQKHTELKNIGVYSSYDLAENAIEKIKKAQGFNDTQNGFKIQKTFRLFKPKLINQTFWDEGFVTYTD